ncbi:Rha family transcriptional regulator [Rosenbergiella epipactidis]|uniref:Rha family transcriptional regulator n=1 Tax=Rosenbergiella epipactidis TaxID=1544694 RepID=UPI003D6ABB3B
MNKMTLTGQGLPYAQNQEVTMSSLEMVAYINSDRRSKAEADGLEFPCKQYPRLQHKHFLAKVPKVLGSEHSAKFLAQYIDSTGRSLPSYQFLKREACLMAMSYSYELQAAIYDYMEELDRQRGGYLSHTISELQQIVTAARKHSDEDSSDAGRRLRKRQDDLPLLNKAEYLVESLGQLKLSFGKESGDDK